MKSIRNIAFSALLTIGAFSAVTYTSCNPDECKDVVCANGGTCIDGNCSCPTGYEGNLCQNKANAKFAGVYSVTETCGSVPSTPYQVIITPGSDATSVIINNLGNYGCSVGGNVTFTGQTNQMALTVNDNKCGYQMNATGNLNGNTLSVTYPATYLGGSDNCTATMTK